jgi:hypothetical protein
MTIDPYAICPGGTGKKIKFCCSDLVSELDKIQRMVDGDQRVACLDYLGKLDGKHPERACLMSVRSILELSLDKLDEAAATIDAFLRKYPENPVALSQSAVLLCRQGKPREAMAPLLRAIEMSGDEVHPHVYRAITTVVYTLAAMRYFIPARALSMRQLELSRGEDKRAAGLYVEIQHDPDLPLFVKDEPDLQPAPEGAPWKFEFDRAYQRATVGEWIVAAEKFAALIPLAGQAPALWRNLALLRGWLADNPGMVEALRKYATLDVPFDDATEAEAMAQLFDESSLTDDVDVLEVEYAVANQSDLDERFAADRQMERLPFDPRSWEGDQEGEAVGPPPRALFTLLDRPIAETAAGLTRDQIPQVIAGVQLFGRETDRAERLVVETDRDRLSMVESLLRRIAGDALGQRTESAERVVDRTRPAVRLFQWDWRVPRDATIEQRKSLHAAERRDRILNRLPKIALAEIGHQTLEQAVAEPAGRIRAAAFILLRDMGTFREQEAEVFNDLRRQLGFPVPGPIDPATAGDPFHTPAVRLHRLEVDKLGDEPLVKLYRRASLLSAFRALVKLGAEILRRPALSDKFSFAEIHGLLAQFSETREEAIVHIDEARAISQKARQSSAPWDLEELRLCVSFADIQGVARLFDHIRREHLREEGVAETLSQILVSAGLIDRSGRVLLPPVAEASPILVPGSAAPSKILTPDGVSPSEERKSVLWTPGME